MLYNDHWDDLKQRMMGYWDREAMDRVCASIMVQKPGYQDFGEHNFYFDAETADKTWRGRFENNHYFGESSPCLFPYFGTAGIAEYTGCKANRAPRTTWFEPWMADDDEPDASRITYKCPEAFQQQKDAIARLIDLSKDDYTVSVTDNCGIMDAVKPLLGNCLHLSCGGCNLCERCAKMDGLPCRMPDKALTPMEGYGIDVYQTTKPTELKYINGQNTVTFFGIVLF